MAIASSSNWCPVESVFVEMNASLNEDMKHAESFSFSIYYRKKVIKKFATLLEPLKETRAQKIIKSFAEKVV